MNSLSSRLAVAQALTIRSSVCRLECSGRSPWSPSCRPRRRSAASSPCLSPRLPAWRVRASSRRSPKRCSSSRQAVWARGRSLWTRALLPSSATRVTTMWAWSEPPSERPCRIATHRHCARAVAPAKPICSTKASTISAHCSSASSGSCGCSDREQCHTCASRAPDHPAVLVALGDRHLGAERVPRLIEEPRQRNCVAAVEKPPLPHPDRLRRPGDQVRVVVLLTLALADQVDQHPVCLAAAGDVGDHRLTPVSRRRFATSSSTSRSVSSSRRSEATSPEMFAERASWLTLFATVASSRRVSNSSATIRRRSVGVSTPESADSTISRGTDSPSSAARARSRSRSCSVSLTCWYTRRGSASLPRRTRPVGRASGAALTAPGPPRQRSDPPPGRDQPGQRSVAGSG